MDMDTIEAIFSQLSHGHNDMMAAAHHWNEDRELAELLLRGAIIHHAKADYLAAGESYETLIAAYLGE